MNLDQVKYKFNKVFFEKIKEGGLDPSKYAIAGGALRDSIVGDKVKDVDLFCKDAEAVMDLEKWFVRQPNVKIYNSNTHLSNFKLNGYWFQIIKDKFFDLDGSELIENFDFTICGIMVHNDEVRVLPTFFEDLLSKRLRVNKLIYPLSTFERMQKYIKKGYSACNGTLLEIAKGIQTIDLSNPRQDSLRFYPDGTPRFIGID